MTAREYTTTWAALAIAIRYNHRYLSFQCASNYAVVSRQCQKSSILSSMFSSGKTTDSVRHKSRQKLLYEK
jgi:hypothetical protein